MSKARRITTQVFGLAMLVAGIVFVARGLQAVLRPDVTCGEIVMGFGDHCRNRGSRGDGWYLLDYAGQRRHLHENGLLALALGGGAAFFGLVFLLAPWWVKNSAAATPKPVWRFVGYAIPILPAIGYAVGEYLTGDVGWPILLLIPVIVAATPVVFKYGDLRNRQIHRAGPPPQPPV